MVGRGTERAEDTQGTPTQSHLSPSILIVIHEVYHTAITASDPGDLVVSTFGFSCDTLGHARRPRAVFGADGRAVPGSATDPGSP